jgi:dihydroorotate dehydrogenase electron transfer subunit
MLAENAAEVPFLPRAFSIGGMRGRGDGIELDVIYRVVGVATRWMESLACGDGAVLIGPLGKPFRIREEKQHAWLIIGGVGLPPLLWLAESLHRAGRSTVAFLGARSRELIPVELQDATSVSPDASRAHFCAAEFSAVETRMVISTDDGGIGFHGNVVDALRRYHAVNPVAPADLTVYTCGPERMMHAAAEYCLACGIECQVCMERSMACGTGTCQSCVVAVRSDAYATGQRYALCCTEGPVFAADQLLWD